MPAIGSVFPKDIGSHLRKYHKSLSLSERTAIVTHIKGLDTIEPEQFLASLLPNSEIDAIDGLPSHDLFRCNTCQKLAAETTLIRHCRDKHKWTSSNGKILTYYAYCRCNVGEANGTNTTSKYKRYQILSSQKDAFKSSHQQ